eukprot:scaffold8055_cov239-Pinguiococcus_pyrenoidosus.AAC.2
MVPLGCTPGRSSARSGCLDSPGRIAVEGGENPWFRSNVMILDNPFIRLAGVSTWGLRRLGRVLARSEDSRAKLCFTGLLLRVTSSAFLSDASGTSRLLGAASIHSRSLLKGPKIDGDTGGATAELGVNAPENDEAAPDL